MPEPATSAFYSAVKQKKGRRVVPPPFDGEAGIHDYGALLIVNVTIWVSVLAVGVRASVTVTEKL